MLIQAWWHQNKTKRKRNSLYSAKSTESSWSVGSGKFAQYKEMPAFKNLGYNAVSFPVI